MEEKQNGFCRYIVTNKVTLLAASHSACVVYTKTITHLSVGESGRYLPTLRLIIVNYYMASSAGGQDEPNRAMRLATRADKIEPSCPLGTSRCIPQETFPRKPYNKSFIDQVCSVKMAGYWPGSFFASSWTPTSSRFIKTQ